MNSGIILFGERGIQKNVLFAVKEKEKDSTDY